MRHLGPVSVKCYVSVFLCSGSFLSANGASTPFLAKIFINAIRLVVPFGLT